MDKLLEISLLELQANTKNDFIKLENKIREFKSRFALSEQEWLSDIKCDDRKLEVEEETSVLYEGEIKETEFNEIVRNLNNSLDRLVSLKENIYKSVNNIKGFPISPNGNNIDRCGEPEVSPSDAVGKLKLKIEWLDGIIGDYQVISNHLFKIVG